MNDKRERPELNDMDINDMNLSPEGRSALEEQLRRLRPAAAPLDAERILQMAGEPSSASPASALPASAPPVTAPPSRSPWLVATVASLTGLSVGVCLGAAVMFTLMDGNTTSPPIARGVQVSEGGQKTRVEDISSTRADVGVRQPAVEVAAVGTTADSRTAQFGTIGDWSVRRSAMWSAMQRLVQVRPDAAVAETPLSVGYGRGANASANVGSVATWMPGDSLPGTEGASTPASPASQRELLWKELGLPGRDGAL
ncbi:MAG: hypothetical protein KDB14_19605 [Planctomycetales bacterium]|nr:hypothetical protein [Planctomycetales bacterium]